jgi:hypothetical protein
VVVVVVVGAVVVVVVLGWWWCWGGGCGGGGGGGGGGGVGKRTHCRPLQRTCYTESGRIRLSCGCVSCDPGCKH